MSRKPGRATPLRHLTSAVARLGTPSAGAVCRAAEIPRLRSRFVDGLLPLSCGQDVHNRNMRTSLGLRSRVEQ
jgi:hypothetical protein